MLTVLAGTLLLQLTACGTLFHGERKGQQASNQVDPTVLILDCCGFLFGIIPGVVALVIDYSNNTIYYTKAEVRANQHSSVKDIDRSGMIALKMDDMSKLGYIASHLLLDGLSFSPEDMAVILQNRSASLDSDLKHLRNITEGPGASPAVFVYTLPNVASGEISIRHKIKGDNTFFISSSYDKEGMEEYARMVLASSKAKYCIVGWLEYLGGEYDADFELIEKIWEGKV